MPAINIPYLDYFRLLINEQRKQQGLPVIDFSTGPGAPVSAAPAAAADSGTATGEPAPGPVTTDIAGRNIADNAILPGKVPTVSPDLTKKWNEFLAQRVGSGASPFPGQLSPDINQTVLPQAFAAAPGMLQTNPILSRMMTYGGTGGPGNYGMANAMNFGTPSMVGQWLHNVAETGVSSPGAGGPLQALAAGDPSGAGKWLLPFLMRNVGGNSGYSAPMMPIRNVTIGGR